MQLNGRHYILLLILSIAVLAGSPNTWAASNGDPERLDTNRAGQVKHTDMKDSEDTKVHPP